jgi:hypothetical protein
VSADRISLAELRGDASGCEATDDDGEVVYGEWVPEKVVRALCDAVEAAQDVQTWLDNAGNWAMDDPEWRITARCLSIALAPFAGAPVDLPVDTEVGSQ